ncbi:hypothetical protein IZ6_26770 [Terrihabitans soli]|uniref:Uncharacterized protein n=1 Tax=Terrihabitans soli TaxID=708113 RepID=A0A6S6QXE1_9HYPH|nr:hypothetical protein IZ6_26770 [Terrihabitans soli]
MQMALRMRQAAAVRSFFREKTPAPPELALRDLAAIKTEAEYKSLRPVRRIGLFVAFAVSFAVWGALALWLF